MNFYYSMDLFGDYTTPNIDSALKLPICLILDKSGSMAGTTSGENGKAVKIDELNANVKRFLEYVKNDPKASKICDISIIGFGGETPEVISGYTTINKMNFTDLRATGRTPMGAAVMLAIELLQKRREYYRSVGIEHYKPIMMLMSDGEPTDHYDRSASKCSEMVRNKQMKIYPVGIGDGFNRDILSLFSPELPPKRINDISGFMKLFELLSRSSSNPNDDSIDKWFKDTL